MHPPRDIPPPPMDDALREAMEDIWGKATKHLPKAQRGPHRNSQKAYANAVFYDRVAAYFNWLAVTGYDNARCLADIENEELSKKKQSKK